MSDSFQVRKFPEIYYKNKKLIWDQRQENSSDEIIYIRSVLNDKQKKELLNRASGKSEVIYEEKISFYEILQQHYKIDFSKFSLFGVTGTNGKTTCATLIRHLLLKKGFNVMEIGTLGASLWKPQSFQEAESRIETGFTTPDQATLFDLLKQSELLGIQAVVMEVTSHAISLGRVAGLHFHGKLFTNLSQDHLDYHLSMENYKNVKKSWITSENKKSTSIVLNSEDHYYAEIKSEIKGTEEVIGVSQTKLIEKLQLSVQGASFIFQGKKIEKLPIYSTYNLENALFSSYLISQFFNEEVEGYIDLLKDYPGVPGRMEFHRIEFQGKSLNFVIDFAHTPDALEKILSSSSVIKNKSSQLFCVFGCGGNRDPIKRPIMGEKAQKFSDVVIVTSDNPREEDPEMIIEDIKKGLRLNEKVLIESDRLKAIHLAATQMNNGDLCVIAGKGHEEYQLIKGVKFPFSDRQVVLSLNLN